MQIVKTNSELQAIVKQQKMAGKIVGLVPTMGALHAGHLSLVDIARKNSDYVITYIYVNPLQFNNPSDLEKYPRTLERDIQELNKTSCDLLFVPSTKEIYPQGDMLTTSEQVSTRVTAGDKSQGLCGATRPGHFTGVTTVLSKFFNIIQPDVAVFGDKDYQQVKVIQQLVYDLCFPIKVIAAPIVRDPDGLALSSRNELLTAEQREHALLIPRALFGAQRLVKEGKTSVEEIKAFVNKAICSSNYLKPDYIEVVDCDTLKPITQTVDKDAQLIVAAFCGTVRLIDNVRLAP